MWKVRAFRMRAFLATYATLTAFLTYAQTTSHDNWYCGSGEVERRLRYHAVRKRGRPTPRQGHGIAHSATAKKISIVTSITV
jgi:hypothetical protein